MAIVHFPLKLVSRRMIAPTVAHLSFVRDDGQPLDYIPGQFIQVHFSYADGTPARRSVVPATLVVSSKPIAATASNVMANSARNAVSVIEFAATLPCVSE